MGISNVQASAQTTFAWQLQNEQTGVYSPIQTSTTLRKTQGFTTDETNTTSGGGDEVFSFQQSISAGSSATVDLTTMTNQLGQASVAIVRAKSIQVRLLSATDDPSISPAPNANSTVTVTNISVATPSSFDMTNAGSGLTVDLTVVAGAINVPTINTAGSGYPKSSFFMVTPCQNTASGGGLVVATNAAGIPTSVQAITNAAGSSYSNASNVPTTVLGQYTILTGGAHAYFDPKATGFLTISALTKNIKILNNDATNAVTAEITVFGCTS